MEKHEHGRILIFSKDGEFVTSLCEILSRAGYTAVGCTVCESALEALKNQSFDLFLADIEMPEMDGIALISASLKIDPYLVNIVIINQETIETYIDVVRIGAFDCVMRPFKLEGLLIKISRAMEVRRLRKSEDMYQSIFENAVEGIYLITPEEQYIAANLALAHIFGYDSVDDLIKNLINDGHRLYVEPDRRLKFISLIKKIDIVSGFESRVYHKSGDKIWISENVCAVRDANSNLVYFRGTVEDITRRKKAEEALCESETHFRLLAEKGEKNKNIFLDVIEDLCDSCRKLEGLFMSFVIAIINALEERRPWMKGRSERVAAYSMKIAKEMGLSEDEREKLKLAALLHDIGEFFAYDCIIDKPRLSDEELGLIREHPVQGAIILKRIKQLNDIIPLIRHHHERVDGKGYPDGLKGEEIPVGARILHLADSFDSMTADRPYRRPAPGREYAFLEFKKYNNTQFDPKVAEVAMKVL